MFEQVNSNHSRTGDGPSLSQDSSLQSKREEAIQLSVTPIQCARGTRSCHGELRPPHLLGVTLQRQEIAIDAPEAERQNSGTSRKDTAVFSSANSSGFRVDQSFT